MQIPELPAYETFDAIAVYFPQHFSRQTLRRVLTKAGATTNLSEDGGRRTVVVVEKLRERFPEVYRRLFDAAVRKTLQGAASGHKGT